MNVYEDFQPEADIYVNDMLYEAVPLNKDAVKASDKEEKKP